MVDLRNPTRSDGYNLLTLINRYMDMARKTGNLAARAKAEKYAKILAKTIVSPDGDTDYGQNAYFYDAAEKSAIFLILPEEDTTKNFMTGMMIQTLARELCGDENGDAPHADEAAAIPRLGHYLW